MKLEFITTMSNISRTAFSNYSMRIFVNASLSNVTSIGLDYFNDEETRRRIVPITFLTLLSILGIQGNFMIIYIYLVKFRRKATHQTFVLALAFADFFVCCFAIPFEIYQMTKEYTFYNELLCKVLNTFKSALIISSALLLMSLSLNRYWSICKPLHRQLQYNQALWCVCFIFGLSVLLAVPDFFFTGIKTHDLGNGLIGRDCSDSDYYSDTPYPMAYTTSQLAFYVLCNVVLLVMCCSIGRKIIRHLTFRKQFRMSVICGKKPNGPENKPSTTTPNDSPRGQRIKQYFKRTERNKTNHKQANSPTKVTKTAVVVSLCFVVVYLPYIIIRTLSAVTGGHLMVPGKLASAIMPILSRTHYINNVTNCIVYLILDLAFRKQSSILLLSVYNRLFFCQMRIK